MKVPHIKITRDDIIIVCLIIIMGIGVVYAVSLVKRYYIQGAIRQPLWVEFDEEDTEPKFALTKIASSLVPGDGNDGMNYFFRNRVTAHGWSTNSECYKTQYKCGDGKWENFEGDYVLLENRCIVKVKNGTYCNVILPGGTLIAATSAQKKTDWFNKGDLIFQIISTDSRITIIQNVTKQESLLWHTLAPKFSKEYVVELGDVTAEATGTEFYTSTDEELGSVTTVIKGSVKVYGTTITKRQYVQVPYFNVLACPPALKACGNSCIPANGVCCDANSYCLYPIQCQENPTGTCKANLFTGDSSQYCCYNSTLSSSFSLFDKGSYDCDDGYKFCANRCIPEDQECCYPTDDDCPVAEDAVDIGTGDVPSDYEFPRQYFFDLYNKLRSSDAYLKLVSDSAFAQDTFNFDDVLQYITEYLKPIVEKDYANSNEAEEQATFCTNYPASNICPNKSTSGGTSASGDCSMMNDISITWCYPEDGNTKSGYVYCGFKIVKNKEKYCQDSNIGGVQMTCGDVGDGQIPKKCLPKGFSSWVNP
jgi:hypothetical protein